MTSALAWLHLRHRVCHRDFKPPNLLCRSTNVTTPGCIKLCDFGFAHKFGRRSVPQFELSCGALWGGCWRVLDFYFRGCLFWLGCGLLLLGLLGGFWSLVCGRLI